MKNLIVTLVAMVLVLVVGSAAIAPIVGTLPAVVLMAVTGIAAVASVQIRERRSRQEG